MLRWSLTPAKPAREVPMPILDSAIARRFWENSVASFAAADTFGSFYATRARLSGAMLRASEKNRRVLEVGCGSGRLAALLAQAGHAVTALDLSPEQLTRAQERCEGHAVDLRLGGLEVLSPTERFDVVFALGVLPYIPDQPNYVSALGQRVTAGGCLCVSITRAASIFTIIELARHLIRFRPTTNWWLIATNLFRTGLWSGGFMMPSDRISIGGLPGLDRTMRQEKFFPIEHFALFNITSLDRAPDRRGSISAWLADHLAWCIVSMYERSP